MKKLFLLSTIMITTTAMAFGGSGSGRKATYEPGLVAIGAHFGGNGQAHIDTNCPEGSSTSGQGGETGVFDGDVMCKCDAADKVYTVNGCELQPEVCTDHTANQCGLGYYCQFSPTSCDSSSCCESSRGDGVCTAISGGTDVTPAGDSTKTYLKGPQTDWWSAYSWCIGNGKDLVTGTIAGQALNSSYENYNGPLYSYFDQGISFWTGHDYGNFCYVWCVYADSSYEVVSRCTHDFSEYALCE